MENPVKTDTMVLKNVKMAGMVGMVSVILIMEMGGMEGMAGMVIIHPQMERQVVMVEMVVPVAQNQILRAGMAVPVEAEGMEPQVATAAMVQMDS